MAQLDMNQALRQTSEADEGVGLSRLLELTTLRAAQVVVVGLEVLRDLRAVHAAGHAHGSVCAGEVRVGGDGQVSLDGAAEALGASVPVEQRQRADLAAVGVLLDQLTRAARRSPVRAEEGAPALFAALNAAVDRATRPDADIELVAAPLAAACGPGEDALVRSELAALVNAVSGSGPVSSAAEQAPPRARPGLGRPALLGAWLRGLWRRIGTWVVALAVLVAVVALEFALLHERLAQDLALLWEAAEQPDERAAASGEERAQLPPVPRPAPASAEVVGGVDVRAVQPCVPGAVCAVRILVQLQPQPELATRSVQWTFHVLDRCTGSARTLPGGVVSAAPDGDQVQFVSTVPLPPAHALAVIAVTSEPARAASAPLLVPARADSCPSN